MMKNMKIVISIVIFIITFSIGCINHNLPIESKNDSHVSNNISQNIVQTLEGHQIVYYDIAGNSRNYTISKKDIHAIQKSEFNDKIIWIVRVGRGMEWEIHLNETGETILEEIQLFRT